MDYAKTIEPATGVNIQNYGLFFERDLVDWEKMRILGRKTNKLGNKTVNGNIVNFFEQKGIYILYNNQTTVYIGQVGAIEKKSSKENKTESSNTLGKRLKEHLYDDLRDQWNKFSWYGFKRPIKNGVENIKYGSNGKQKELKIYKLENGLVDGRSPKALDELCMLEALLISIFGGYLLNKQKGGWKKLGVIEYTQVRELKYDADFENDIIRRNLPSRLMSLDKIENRIASLEELIQQKLNQK